MENILFINACVRENSRTMELARDVLERLSGKVSEVKLESEDIKPLDRITLEKRENLTRKGDFSDDMFRYAKQLAAADTVVIAAPYWDLMFPSLLKIYLEQVCVCGITFKYIDDRPVGLCRAKHLIYVTTAGGSVYFNFGFDYVKALAESFFGIEKVTLFNAEKLDMYGSDTDAIIKNAKKEIYEYFK